MHFRLVEIVFLDFISTTETFAAFCGGCLSFFICFSSSKFRVTHKPKNKYDVGGNIPTCFPINQDPAVSSSNTYVPYKVVHFTYNAKKFPKHFRFQGQALKVKLHFINSTVEPKP
jgi:hypothetical protein